MEFLNHRDQQRMNTTNHFDLTDEAVYNFHANLLIACANSLLKHQNKKFVVDDTNRQILRFLLYYFNDCPLAEHVEIKGKTHKLGRPILLNGYVGAGKTLIMDAFALYLKYTKNQNAFISTSMSEVLNYYKVNGHLDEYMYRVGKNSIDCNPRAICINDIGLQQQKYFGEDMQMIVNDLMFARYEIWTQTGICCHLTTNLSAKDMKQVFYDSNGRIIDRMKIYNVINLTGESRR